jgi:hypothetical protein
MCIVIDPCDHYWERDEHEVEDLGFRPYTDVFLRCTECGATRDIGDGDCDPPDPSDRWDCGYADRLERDGMDAYFRGDKE